MPPAIDEFSQDIGEAIKDSKNSGTIYVKPVTTRSLKQEAQACYFEMTENLPPMTVSVHTPLQCMPAKEELLAL